MTLSTDDVSGALIVTLDGVDTALINAPWAYDAHGVPQPTHYEIDGDTFTQIVEPAAENVAYPIVADPRVNWESSVGTSTLARKKQEEWLLVLHPQPR